MPDDVFIKLPIFGKINFGTAKVPYVYPSLSVCVKQSMKFVVWFFTQILKSIFSKETNTLSNFYFKLFQTWENTMWQKLCLSEKIKTQSTKFSLKHKKVMTKQNFKLT